MFFGSGELKTNDKTEHCCFGGPILPVSLIIRMISIFRQIETPKSSERCKKVVSLHSPLFNENRSRWMENSTDTHDRAAAERKKIAFLSINKS